MIQGMYNNYVLMDDTNEYYSDPSHRNVERKGRKVGVHVQINAYAADKGKRLCLQTYLPNCMTSQATIL